MKFRRSDSLQLDSHHAKLLAVLRARIARAKSHRPLDGRSAFFRWYLHTRHEVAQHARKTLIISSKITVAKSLYILLLNQREHTSEDCPKARRLQRAMRVLSGLLGGEGSKKIFMRLVKERADCWLLRILVRQYGRKVRQAWKRMREGKEARRLKEGVGLLQRVMGKMNNYNCSTFYEIKRFAQVKHLHRQHAISSLAQALSHLVQKSQLNSLSKLRAHSANKTASSKLLHLLHELVQSRHRAGYTVILRTVNRNNRLAALSLSLSHITGRRRARVLVSAFNSLAQASERIGIARNRTHEEKEGLKKALGGLLVKQKMKLLFATRMLRFNQRLQGMIETRRKQEVAGRLATSLMEKVRWSLVGLSGHKSRTELKEKEARANGLRVLGLLVQRKERKSCSFAVRQVERNAYQGRYKELALRRTVALIGKRWMQEGYNRMKRNRRCWEVLDMALKVSCERTKEVKRGQLARLHDWCRRMQRVEQGARRLSGVVKRRREQDVKESWRSLSERARKQVDKYNQLGHCLDRLSSSRKSAAWHSLQLFTGKQRSLHASSRLNRLHEIFLRRLSRGFAEISGRGDAKGYGLERVGRGLLLAMGVLERGLRKGFEGIRLEGRYRLYRQEYMRQWRSELGRRQEQTLDSVDRVLSKRGEANRIWRACRVVEALVAKGKAFGFQGLLGRMEGSRRREMLGVLARRLAGKLEALVRRRKAEGWAMVRVAAREKRSMRVRVKQEIQIKMKAESSVTRSVQSHSGLVLKRYVYFTRFCKVVSHMLLDRKKAFFAALLSRNTRGSSPEQYSSKKGAETSRTRVSARSVFTMASSRTVEDRIAGLQKLKNVMFDLGRTDYGAPKYVHEF
jgi:hypothetical protein